jgi:hypothetical protein
VNELKENLGVSGKIYVKRSGYEGMPTLDELEKMIETKIN